MTGDRLDRFVKAQAEVFDTALAELVAGRKRSHWMWFVFPQLTGLGRSPTAAFYGLAGLEEARAYLAHPLLGDRLRQCVQALLHNRGRRASEIFGFPDDAKLRSCLTLFEAAASTDADGAMFGTALDAFCDGKRDTKTLSMIGVHDVAGGGGGQAAIEQLGAVRNPTTTQLVALIKSSAVRAARRIVCERTGDVWCWPAEKAGHSEGARIVGARYTQAGIGDLLTMDD